VSRHVTFDESCFPSVADTPSASSPPATRDPPCPTQSTPGSVLSQLHHLC
jgi:hypothetical protein